MLEREWLRMGGIPFGGAPGFGCQQGIAQDTHEIGWVADDIPFPQAAWLNEQTAHPLEAMIGHPLGGTCEVT